MSSAEINTYAQPTLADIVILSAIQLGTSILVGFMLEEGWSKAVGTVFGVVFGTVAFGTYKERTNSTRLTRSFRRRLAFYVALFQLAFGMLVVSIFVLEEFSLGVIFFTILKLAGLSLFTLCLTICGLIGGAKLAAR